MQPETAAFLINETIAAAVFLGWCAVVIASCAVLS
jgi:hypothetical protein